MGAQTDHSDQEQGGGEDATQAFYQAAPAKGRFLEGGTIRRCAILSMGILYWFVYAASNDMLFYYQTNVYPFLAATNTPNPYFFLRTVSPIDLYESGVIWFPTEHIGLVLLAGDTFFSVLLTSLAIANSANVYDAIRRGILNRNFRSGRFSSIAILTITVLMCLAPLEVLAVIALSGYFTVTSLEIWVTNYSYVDNTLDALILGLLVVLWRRIMGFLRSSIPSQS